MCAAKQHTVKQQFALNQQCAIKQCVYQYQEWQCVWNQHMAAQDAAAELSASEMDAWHQYVGQQQYSPNQHEAQKYSQQHYGSSKNALEQYALGQYAAPQWGFNQDHEEQEEYCLRQDAVEQFSLTQEVAEQYDQDAWDLNHCAIEQYHEEECDFNQYAVQQYLVEQFPRQCYTETQNVPNQFMREHYTFDPYYVGEHHEKDHEFNQHEQYSPSQYVEKHQKANHQHFAEDPYTLNQNASEQYGLNQHTEQWYPLNQYEEEPLVMYNYAAEQCGKEQQYHSTAHWFAEKQLEAQQFTEGHCARNPYAAQQYVLDEGGPQQGAAGPHPAGLIAFPHTQQFVAVQYTPNPYPGDQYLSNQYAAAEHLVPHLQYQADQYPESVYVVDHYVVKQQAAAQYKGDVCPFSQCAPGKYPWSPCGTQQYVTGRDAAKLQAAAAQYEAQQHALKYPEPYAWNQFEGQQCGLSPYSPGQYVMGNQRNALKQYATQVNALNPFKAEEHDLNYDLAEQYAISHQQNVSNRHSEEQRRSGRSASGLYKNKQDVTNNSRPTQCSLNQRGSQIYFAGPCPTQQDGATSAMEHGTRQDCRQEAARRDSAKPEVAEGDLDHEEDKVRVLDATEGGTSSPHVAECDAIESKAGAHLSESTTKHKGPNCPGSDQSDESCFPSHHAVKQGPAHQKASQPRDPAEASQAAQPRPGATSEHERSERREPAVQEPLVDSTENHHDSVETDGQPFVPSSPPSNPDVAEGDAHHLDAAEVIAAGLDPPEQKPKDSGAAERDAAAQDPPAGLKAAGQDAPQQAATQLNVSAWGIARRTPSGQDPAEPDAAEQGSARNRVALQNVHELRGVVQEASPPAAVEQAATERRPKGSSAPEKNSRTIRDAEQNDPERDAAAEGPGVLTAPETVEAKRSVMERRGTILDATGHNSAQLDAGDRGAIKQGSSAREHTEPDDGDATGQMVPEQQHPVRAAATECEGATQGTAETQGPSDHSAGVADAEQHDAAQNLRDMNVQERDSAEKYRRKGTRSCRTGCSRGLFGKGQSSRSRYYSRNHYSARCCND